MIKLLPCPFCGGRAKCRSDEYGYNAWAWVQCNTCDARSKSVPFHIYFHCKTPQFRNFKNKAREIWNKRMAA